MERVKQDDALSDLSNILDQIKDMSIDMGLEISRCSFSLLILCKFAHSCSQTHMYMYIYICVCNFIWFELKSQCIYTLSLHIKSYEVVSHITILHFNSWIFTHNSNGFCRQNVSLESFYNDASKLEDRVKDANSRGRRLLGK